MTSPPAPAPHDSTVEITDLDVVRGGTSVLTVGELAIPPGYTAIVGPNGSGKSTLLHVIAGLIAPQHGTVVVGGRDVGTRRPRLAYVLQTQQSAAQLFVTAREVVALARSVDRGPFRRLHAEDRRVVEESMERLEVSDLADRHLADMSGGQRQRVFIAQGLAQGADVVLLDEPVAGLDLASAQTIRRAVDAERASGRTVIVATHDLDEAARADRAGLLDGRVVAFGAPGDVLTSDHLRAAYHGRVLEIGNGLVVDDGVHHDHPH